MEVGSVPERFCSGEVLFEAMSRLCFNATKRTEYMFLSQEESIQVHIVFSSVCTRRRYNCGTFHFSAGLQGVELSEKILLFLQHMPRVLLGRPVGHVPCHATGSSSFWIVHKYHVVSLKDHQRLVFVVICNYSAMRAVSVSVSRTTLQGPVH